MKPASLSSRITLLLVITSLVILGGGAMLMDWRIDHEMDERFQQNLLTQAQTLIAMIELEQDALSSGRVLPPQAGILGGEGHAYYELRCAGIPPLRSSPALPVLPANWPEAAGAKPRYGRLHAHHAHLSTVMLTVQPPQNNNGNQAAPPRHDCRLLFAQDRRPLDQILLALDWILALSPALALGIALIAVPFIVRRGLRPMKALVERMSDIGPQAPSQRLAPSGLRELDPLVSRFNDVLARMDEGLARERQFASGLAHETRTRLAELRALAEIESRYPSGRSLPEVLAEVGSISAELEATVTALLLLTRLQGGLEQPHPQLLILAPWLERQAQRYASQASERGVELQLHIDQAGNLHTDPALFEVVIGNLLGNACAYAATGDTVQVRVEPSAISIDNAAPNLHDSDLPSLGQRFWRKQPQHAGHAGLGLALAQAAAAALGMQLSHRLDDGQRLHVRLSWAAAHTPPARAG
ncbi:sensor histidine kinase [Dyella silvatica]|uniref:sensor histidine kinase n=1 Tax=Dyella silvatica TaxID=2992128 RepID=UPI002258C2CD|nr:HAMP domain-containing sensor histidine kinase [Dyella silvatica]